MIRRPPRSTRTDTLYPYTTLFRSEMDLQGRAAIVGGGSRSVSEIPAQKCSGAGRIGLAAREILARGREAVDRTRGGQEGDPVTEFLVPGIPREDCVAGRIVIGCSERCLLAVNCSEQPFRIIGGREAARAWREVAQAQADQFDGRSEETPSEI